MILWTQIGKLTLKDIIFFFLFVVVRGRGKEIISNITMLKELQYITGLPTWLVVTIVIIMYLIPILPKILKQWIDLTTYFLEAKSQWKRLKSEGSSKCEDSLDN